MATLLIVHHTPSPAMAEMLDAVLRGATDPDITGVEVVRRPALGAGPADVLAADAILLGTPANIGYMSGALKHFFDQIYYPVLDATKALPYGLYVHGNLGTEGAVRSVERITSGLGWRAVGRAGRGHRAARPRAAGGVLGAGCGARRNRDGRRMTGSAERGTTLAEPPDADTDHGEDDQPDEGSPRRLEDGPFHDFE